MLDVGVPFLLVNEYLFWFPGTRPCLPELPHEEYREVLEIFSLCTEQEPPSRPSAKQILDGYFRD